MRWERTFLIGLVTCLLAAVLVFAVPQPSVGAPGTGHTTALVDPLSGKWHLYDAVGVMATSFYYGNPGDYPFMGDWDGDGVETPGLYRQSDGYVYLRNSNTQGVAEIKFFFGNPGDVPVAGDFNGNGFDTVSIYRPSNQTFYIINKLGSNDGGLGAAEMSYVFGNPGDKLFVGDFDADGVETVGLHRESTGLVYFRNTHTQGNADAQFIFGDPGDRLIAGDWTGDGVFTPALFRPSNTTTYFRYSNSQGNADHQFTAGMSGWMPVSGNVAAGADPGGSPGVNEIDPEKTLLPDADDVVFHALNNEGQSHLTYTGKVDVGDVIVMGITPETPEGFLGKVTSVSGGEVTTRPASLMDAIPEADFSVTVPLQPARGYSAYGDYAATSLVGFGCGGQAVSVDVNSTFDAGSMVFEAKWGWTGLRRFEAGWRDLSVNGEVTLTAAAGIGCSVVRPISQVPLPPITFTIGFVPVVIVPSVTTDVSLTAATYGGVTVGGDFSAGYGGGLVYEGGNWSSYTDPTLSAHAFSPVLNTGGSVTLEVRHGLRGDIYGVGGPSVDVGPFVELAANTSLDPWWTIDGGLSAGMDISTNGWLIDLSYELLRLRLLSWRLAEAQSDPPGGDPLTITTTALPDGTVGEPYSAGLTATGGSPPYVWDLGSGQPPNGLAVNSDGSITGTPTTTGTASFAARVTDADGDSDSQQLALTIGTGSPGQFDCDAQSSIPAVECRALVALYNSTDGANWVDNGGWLVDPDPSNWSGVGLIDYEWHVGELWLRENGLNGTLPAELGDLSRLRYLDVFANPQLGGAIPPEIGQLTELTNWSAWQTNFDGPLPPELGNLSALEYLFLAGRFDGGLPSSLGDLKNLRTLHITNGNYSIGTLSGSIPSEFGDMTSLTGLHLGGHSLSGEIPAELGNLQNLHTLDLYDNRLSGPVPPELATMPYLTGMRLQGQTGCLTADDPAFADWLSGFDPDWNDGCPIP